MNKLSFPTVTLNNGLTIANFNSPHDFIFEDGSVLKAVSDEIAKETELVSKDVLIFNGRFYNVRKNFIMSVACEKRIEESNNLNVDVILAPLPVIQAMKDEGIPTGRFRTILVVDRVKKIISIDKFCL